MGEGVGGPEGQALQVAPQGKGNYHLVLALDSSTLWKTSSRRTLMLRDLSRVLATEAGSGCQFNNIELNGHFS